MLGQGINSLIPQKKSGEMPPARHIQEESLPRVPLLSLHKDVLEVPHVHTEEIYEEEKIIPHYEKKEREKSESVFQIEVEKIAPNPYQPRAVFNEESLRELSRSIQEFGILQPLVVSKTLKENESGAEVEYQLIAGERRLMAAKLAGLRTVPAIVKKIDLARTKLELALIENIQRSNLNPIESARAYARLQDEFGLSQREIALRVGKSREAVTNTLRLLQLPFEIQQALTNGTINESHARTLLGISDREVQMRLFKTMLERKTTVRELKEKIPHTSQPQERVDPEQKYWERQLEEKLGSPAKIVRQGTGGKIIVQFYSDEEYQNVLRNMVGEE